MNSEAVVAQSTAPKRKRRTQAKVRPTVGTIQERNGSWFWLFYSLGKKVSVKLGRTSEITSKSAACDEANRRHKNGDGPARNDSDGVTRNGSMQITEYAEEHFLKWAEREKTASTAHGYKQVYNAHLKAHFGTMKLAEYETHIATKFFGKLAAAGKLNRTSISHVQAVASKLFSNAVAEGHIADNPIAKKAKLLVKPKKQKVKTLFYELEEMAQILHALDSDANAKAHAVMALTFVGLRRAETMGLKWEDLNLASGSLWVRRSAWMGKASETPKNQNSVREVTLGTIATNSLLRWKRLAPTSLNGFVFENEAGKPLDLGLFSTRHLRPALEAKGVVCWKGFHSGRRGAETEMQRFTNGNAQTTHAHFGHSVEVAQSHYTGPVPEETRKAALALDAAVAEKITVVANSIHRVQ